MDVDQIHLAQQDEITHKWLVVMNRIGHNVTKLASMFNDEKPCYVFSIAGGSFNYCIAVEFEDGQEDRTRWMIRLPIPGRVMDPETKIKHEVATMKFLYEMTDVPVPKIIAYGTTKENYFFGVGPFIIMEYIEGKPLSEVLMGKPLDEVFRRRSVKEHLKEVADRAEAATGDEEGPLLSPDISDETLTIIYRQMANVYLELSEWEFDKIGSLSMVATKGNAATIWPVEDPPHTLDNNEQRRIAGVPADGKLLSSEALTSDKLIKATDNTAPFTTASAYLSHLSLTKLKHLTAQRNSVEDVADACEKYTSRHLLRKLLPYFLSPAHNNGPFHLVCDDLRPHNILVDRDLRIVAICDWEWSYTAPYEFTSSAPNWLILRNPDAWTQTYRFDAPGPDDLLSYYKSKLDLFLTVMEEEETRRFAAQLYEPKVHDFAYPWASVIAVRGSPPPSPNSVPVVPVVKYDVPTLPLNPLSKQMRASITTGQFWHTNLMQGGSFDRIYWQRIDEQCLGKRASTEARIARFVAAGGIALNMWGWVEAKMEELEAYRVELGPAEDGWEVEEGLSGVVEEEGEEEED